jgi:hypothetical protein
MMEDMINKLLELGVGNFMDVSRDQIARNDEDYQQDLRDEEELAKRFQDLELLPEDRKFIEDYIMCIVSVNSRYSDLSYMAGIKDCIQLLNALDVLKKAEIE